MAAQDDKKPSLMVEELMAILDSAPDLARALEREDINEIGRYEPGDEIKMERARAFLEKSRAKHYNVDLPRPDD